MSDWLLSAHTLVKLLWDLWKHENNTVFEVWIPVISWILWRLRDKQTSSGVAESLRNFERSLLSCTFLKSSLTVLPECSPKWFTNYFLLISFILSVISAGWLVSALPVTSADVWGLHFIVVLFPIAQNSLGNFIGIVGNSPTLHFEASCCASS